jgi:manganese-dependent inorganic pyrophosphatase
MNIYHVLGHKNPDTDSICAAYCYAWFKKQMNPENEYIPGICGAPNETTAYIFKRFGVSLPALVKDLHPRVEDVMLTEIITISENEPLLFAIKRFEEGHIRTLPVLFEDKNYLGALSIWEMAEFFMPRDFGKRPDYLFRPENFEKVLPGYFLKQGKEMEFETSLMVGAMSYNTFLIRLHQAVSVDHQDDKYPIIIVGDRLEVVEYALHLPFPAIILTGFNKEDTIPFDISQFKGWLFISEADTAETIRLLRTSVPVKAIANRSLPLIKRTDFVRKAKEMLKTTNYRGLPVVEGNRLYGLVNSSSLVDPPRKKVIMVDHNEFSQSADGIENAEICEIIDHHRINIMKTTNPIYIYAKPLGSTCTLVYQHYLSYKIEIPPRIAALLLAGILTDTVILKSPTSTSEDRTAAEQLARITNLDVTEFGRDIFSHTPNLTNRDAVQVINEDLKIYTEFGITVGIAQVEVVTLSDLDEVKERFLGALEKCRYDLNVQWLMLLVTNILTDDSYLLSSIFPEGEKHLIYEMSSERVYHLPGILSRKKQLLPEILRVLDTRISEIAH